MRISSWRPRPGPGAAGLVALLLAAALLRVALLPARYDMRDLDEPDYLQGGLLMLEGLPPSYHYAPEGPEVWFGWGYAGLRSARYFVAPTAEEARVPA